MDILTSTSSVLNNLIKVYPNPVSEVLNIEVSGQLNFKYSLFDLNGKLITTATNEETIKLNSFSKGIYLLEILDLKTNQKVTEKIVFN